MPFKITLISRLSAVYGHWIPEERPDWVVKQLLAYFGEEQDG